MGLFDTPEPDQPQPKRPGLFQTYTPATRPQQQRPVTAPKAEQPNTDLPPILGLGQGALKALFTPWAAGVGALDTILNDIAKTSATEAFKGAADNVGRLWGSKDLFPEDLKTGETVAREKILPAFGLTPDEQIYIPAAFAANIPGFRGIIAKTGTPLDKAVPIGTNTFYTGLAVDIAADPLTYGLKGVNNVVKGAVKAGSSASKASKLAKRGEVAQRLAAQRAPEGLTQAPLGVQGALRTPRALESVKQNILKVDPKAAERIKKAEASLAANTYKTTRIDSPRGLTEIATDRIASALEAGAKSIANSYTSARNIDFLQQYAKRDVKGVLNKKITAKVSQDAEAGNWVIRSGNGVKLGEAGSKNEAQTLAKKIQAGLDPMEGLVPVTMIQGARKVAEEMGDNAETVAEAAVIPTREGGEVNLEQWVPHEGDDGKFYVFDGENVAEFQNLQDANGWVDVYTSPARGNVEPVLSGKSGAYKVAVGKQVQTFKTKKEADAYIAAVRDGTIPVGRAAATRGGTPIVDTVPAFATVKEALTAPSKKEASALRSVLSKLDDIAKKTSGWKQVTGRQVVDDIGRVLSTDQPKIDRILMDAPPEAYRDIKMFLDDARDVPAAVLFKSLEALASPAKQRMAVLLKQTVPVRTSKGVISFGDALKRSKDNFLGMTKAIEGVDGSTIEQQVARYIDQNIVKRGMALKSGKIQPAFTPEGKYQALVRAAGEEIANKIKATGYLDNPDANKKKYDAILADLRTSTEEVSYQGYDDLVAGLERNDEVSESALQELFKLLDPDGAIIARVEQLNGEPNSAFLRRAFTREGGVTTIREAEKRLALMRDPKILAKHSGLAYSAEIEGMMEVAMRDGSQAFLNVQTAGTKAGAASRFAGYNGTIRDAVADSFGRIFRGNKKGEQGQLTLKHGMAQEVGSKEIVSSIDDWVYLNGEPYADGSRAMFSRQLNQSAEQKMVASLLAKKTGQRQKAKELGRKTTPSTMPERLDNLITELYAANDYAESLGFRFVRTKNRDDVSFQKAYREAIQKAKDTKTTPNFSALSQKHTVYLPMANILDTLRANGGEPALLKALFPTGKVDLSRDVMDTISIGNAARRVLEMDAAGEVIDVNEIATLLMKRAPSRKAPSEARMAIFKQVAGELADVMTEPKVMAELRAVHLDNAASVMKDSLGQAEVFAKDLFDILDETYLAMFVKQDLSEAARAETVRGFFRKFVIAADILRLQDGPVAEAMFKAIALTIADGGKVLPPSKLGQKLGPAEEQMYNLLRQEEYVLFREALTKYYRFADLPSAPPGREGVKPPKAAVKEKAETELQEVMGQYKIHMDQLPGVQASGDLNLTRQWEQTQAKLQTKLNKARNNAWENWVPTFHWDPVDGWVPTEAFDRAKAVRKSEQMHNQYVAGKRGLADRAIYLADSEPVVPPHKILSAGEKKKFLAKYEKDMNSAQADKATSIVNDVANNIADEVDAGRLDMPDLAPNEQMMVAAQNAAARGLKESMEIQLMTVRASYRGAVPTNTVEFNRLYRPLLDEETPVFRADIRAAQLKTLAERWSGYTGRQQSGTILRAAENKAISTSTTFAQSLDALKTGFKGASPESFDLAWQAIREGSDIADDAPRFTKEIYKAMEPMINSTLRSHASSVLVSDGITGKVLAEYFKRFGLDEKIGFPPIGDLAGKTPEELVDSLMAQMPFGPVPSKILGTDEAIAWQQRSEQFKKAGMTPLLAFARTMEAIQMLKQEKGVAANFAGQFGWKAQGYKNMADAVADGWVAIQAEGAQNIARFLPSPEDGGLFRPEMAEEFGSLLREFNNMYTEVQQTQARRYINQMMNVIGTIKFTQTQARVGHHITNLIGDSTSTIFRGTFNPMHWYWGGRLAARFTSTNFSADWAKFGKDFEAINDRLVGIFADSPGGRMPTVGDADAVTLNFYKNGKASAVRIPLDELMTDFANDGILVPGFVQSDLQGLTGELVLEGSTVGQKEAFGRIWERTKRGGRTVMKGFSDFTAAYSNKIRAATAMRVATSRPWSSRAEMMDAILREVNLIHPTIQSLASTERRWGRLAFTYYTWLRVAHLALIDMTINNTAAVLGVPKAMFNYAQMQGFDPQSPAVPFENQNVLPDYISYSVYGPNAMSDQGPRTYRPSFLSLDVADFWQVYYDPSKPLGENVMAAGQQALGVIGKSTNILGQPVLNALTEARGGAKNPLEFAEDALGNLGFTGLLTGLGVYTPYRYRDPETTNPLTEADRKRLLQNWFSGMRSVDIYRPINQKLGQSQYGSRLKQANERTRQENIQKVQDFVNQKGAEGYTREQIIQMLKQMGVN